MSFDLIKTPYEISLVDDGLIYAVYSTPNFSTATFAQLDLTLSTDQADYAGNGFVLDVMGKEIEFRFKTTPETTLGDIHTWDISDTLDIFIQQFIQELLQVHKIRQYFTITYVVNKVTIKAKERGSSYIIDHISNTCNFDDVESFNIDDSALPSDYRLYFALVQQSAGNVNILGSELLPVSFEKVDGNAQYSAETDLAQYVKPLVEFGYTLPKDTNNIVAHPVFEVEFSYADYYDSSIQRVFTEGKVIVLPGGLSPEMRLELNALDEAYFENETRKIRFLSWQPAGKRTAWQVAERLYWLLTETNKEVTLSCRLYTSSGSTVVDIETFSSENDKHVLELLVGLHEMQPSIDPETIVKYDVWLKDDKDGIMSEVRTFTMDQGSYYNSRVFMFRNSFGAYETLRCTGTRTITDNFNRTIAKVMTNRIYKSHVIDAENNPETQMHSGWLQNKGARLWLEELMLSSNVFELVDGALLPVIITTAQIERETDKQYSYGIAFSFVKAYDTKHHSGSLT